MLINLNFTIVSISAIAFATSMEKILFAYFCSHSQFLKASLSSGPFFHGVSVSVSAKNWEPLCL